MRIKKFTWKIFNELFLIGVIIGLIIFLIVFIFATMSPVTDGVGLFIGNEVGFEVPGSSVKPQYKILDSCYLARFQSPVFIAR